MCAPPLRRRASLWSEGLAKRATVFIETEAGGKTRSGLVLGNRASCRPGYFDANAAIRSRAPPTPAASARE